LPCPPLPGLPFSLSLHGNLPVFPYLAWHYHCTPRQKQAFPLDTLGPGFPEHSQRTCPHTVPATTAWTAAQSTVRKHKFIFAHAQSPSAKPVLLQAQHQPPGDAKPQKQDRRAVYADLCCGFCVWSVPRRQGSHS
jgi:hypothetical protein